MSVPLEAGFGLGRATVQLTWLDNNVINKYEVTKYSKYIPIQAGYEVEWKFLKWLSLRAQTGYRQTVLTFLWVKNLFWKVIQSYSIKKYRKKE